MDSSGNLATGDSAGHLTIYNAPIGSSSTASASFINGRVGSLTGSDQLHGCPLGNLALELGSQDPVVRQKLHDMFTAWARVIERS